MDGADVRKRYDVVVAGGGLAGVAAAIAAARMGTELLGETPCEGRVELEPYGVAVIMMAVEYP